MKVTEQIKLTNMSDFLYKKESGTAILQLIEKDDGYLKQNPYYSIGFVLEDGTLYIPESAGFSKLGYSTEDQIAKLGLQTLVSIADNVVVGS